MRLPNLLKYFLFRLLIPIALYVLVVIGGTVAFLCIAPVFGYLGYSDRPGPGWFGHFPAISWSEFSDNTVFMLHWTRLFILLLAAGWIIALGAAPFYLSLLLAVLFGAILLPKRRAPKPADA